MSGSGTAVVVGGGFYGCCIGLLLASRGHDVVLVEGEKELLSRASYRNQARLHGGYHYPRSFSTAYRSRLNLSRFRGDFECAVVRSFTKLYAVARFDSNVNQQQFRSFCRNIGAPLRPARDAHRRHFSPRLVEAVFEAEEFAFDAAELRRLLWARLEQAGVDVRTGRWVRAIEAGRDPVRVVLEDASALEARWVFNCSYSRLNTIAGIPPTRRALKHEITELALVTLPEELASLSVTVVDGPFFSFMPFPDLGVTTLSHVRYTPHASWSERRDGVLAPDQVLDACRKESSFPFMVRDAARYLPCIREARYRDSLFEVKTVLEQNEGDDGRPILLEWDSRNPRVASVLGSKIDNVYDVLTAIDRKLDGR